MPSPLGEGQTDMPINRDCLGEAKPTHRLITAIMGETNCPNKQFQNYKLFLMQKINRHARLFTEMLLKVKSPDALAGWGDLRATNNFC